MPWIFTFNIINKLNDIIINLVCDFLKPTYYRVQVNVGFSGWNDVTSDQWYITRFTDVGQFSTRKVRYKDTSVVAKCRGTKVSFLYQHRGVFTPLPPLGHIWDVRLVWTKENINKNCLCVTVLCTIIMVHKDTSSSYRLVDCIGLRSCLV